MNESERSCLEKGWKGPLQEPEFRHNWVGEIQQVLDPSSKTPRLISTHLYRCTECMLERGAVDYHQIKFHDECPMGLVRYTLEC